MTNRLRENLLNHQATQQLAATLRVLFRQQAIEVAGRTKLDGDVPELVNWVEPIATAAIPLLLKLAQRGILETQLRLAKRGVRSGIITSRASDDVRRYAVPTSVAFQEAVVGAEKSLSQHGTLRRPLSVTKVVGAFAPVLPATARLAFDIFNPRVIDAVNSAAFTFCRETMETARTDLQTALVDLRKLVRGGLQRGEALGMLARRVHQIFADPSRAFRIAVTEASRAQHLGQLLAAKETAVVKRKSWVASSDACELCLTLGEKEPIELDKPFHIEPKGGPYAVIHAPPAHPYCFCSLNEEID